MGRSPLRVHSHTKNEDDITYARANECHSCLSHWSHYWFFDSTIGAGGLISVPALVFLGLPPQVAIATDRMGVIGQGVTSLIEFWRVKKIVWKYVLPLTVLSFVGALIGANVLLGINAAILQKVIGILLVILLPLYHSFS